MLTREASPRGGVVLKNGSSRTLFHELRPGVVLIVAAGPGDQDVNAEVLKGLTEAIERAGTITVFADMSRLSRISLGSIDDSIRWIKRHHAGVKEGHLLIAHVVVSLTVSMIRSAFSGSVRSYTQPALFEAAIRGHVPDFVAEP
ncbi:MAG TPA: hypothetical protein VJN18_01190 [Polyangiaceae bacterium]|nr:hypothetical protein [Polyangiaceae bacterium]